MKKRVLLTGPILTHSGYGEHARFVWRALKARPDLFDVYVKPVNWGQSAWMWDSTPERQAIDEDIARTAASVQQGKLMIDLNIMVTIAPEFKAYHVPNCTNIGVTAGIETDKVAPEWLAQINEVCDKVIVPSEFAKESIINAVYEAKDQFGNEVALKCEKPVEVAHYPVKEYEKADLNLDLTTDFNFLCVAQWSPRKNIRETLRAFLEQFKNDSGVGLILKTQKLRNSTLDRYHVRKDIKEIKDEYPDAKCKVYLLHGYLTNDEMHSLYVSDKVKAIVNFGHGEGYGLPLFEAAYCGLPVITHDFGGQKDFLYAPKGKDGKKRPFFTKVPYKLDKVNQAAVSQNLIHPDMSWAYPNFFACKKAMEDVYNNYGLAKSKADKLKEWVCEEFEESKKYNDFIEKSFGDTYILEDLDSLALSMFSEFDDAIEEG